MLGIDRPYFEDEDALWSSYTDRIAQQIQRCSSNYKPDFLVIAPARTGTTWLAENLRRHPDIHIPPEKEVRFFDIHWRRHDISWYLEQICGNGAQVCGDATPTYALLPSYAIELIRSLNTQLRLVFIMRDPVARAWSHMKHNFLNREANFASGTRCERLEDLDIRTQLENFIHDYPLSAGDYEGILSRWLRYFPRPQFHIIIFDEIQSDPESCLRNVFRFLGVDEHIDLSSFPVRQKINRGGAGEPSLAAAGLLGLLHTPRIQRLEKFVRSTFGLTLPWNAYRHDPGKELIWLMDKPRGWRIYLYNGYFWAIEKTSLTEKGELLFLLSHFNEAKQNNIKRSTFLGDLLHELEKINTATSEPDNELILSQEDRRLTSILKHLAGNYDASLQFHVSVVGNYKGFNIIRYAGRVYGVRQAIGEVDLTLGDNALSHHILANDVVICDSLVGAEARIDAIETNRRVHDIEARTDQFINLIQSKSSDVEKLRSLLNHLEDKTAKTLESLRKRISNVVPEPETGPGLLEENYRAFNLIAYDGKVFAVAMGAGPVNLENSETRERLMAEGQLVEAMTVDGARAAVDRLFDRQQFDARYTEMAQRLAQLEASVARVAQSKEKTTGGDGARVSTGNTATLPRRMENRRQLSELVMKGIFWRLFRRLKHVFR